MLSNNHLFIILRKKKKSKTCRSVMCHLNIKKTIGNKNLVQFLYLTTTVNLTIVISDSDFKAAKCRNPLEKRRNYRRRI